MKSSLRKTSIPSGMKPSSCLPDHVETINDWTRLLDNKELVGKAFLDFMKVFNFANLPRLLAKLDNYGIGGRLLNWFRNNFTVPTFSVHVNDTRSSWATYRNGVPIEVKRPARASCIKTPAGYLKAIDTRTERRTFRHQIKPSAYLTCCHPVTYDIR